MRVLYLTTGCFDKGGVSRYCRYQISALRELFGPRNVSALSLLGPDGMGFETPFAVDWHGGTGKFFDKVQLSQRALRSAMVTRPDVVHVAHVNMASLALLLGRITRARTLLNVYGLEVWSGLSAGRRRAMRGMSRIIADCHFTSAYVATEDMHALKPDVIWDCIDLSRFSPGVCPPETLHRYGIPDKRVSFVILSLGRLEKRAAHKGYDRLIEAFAIVNHKEPRTKLVIGGKGNDRARLEGLVAKHSLADAVSFIGSVAEADLANVYRAANLFSLVSDRGLGRGEGIPLTPLEAMGCGTPIIVGNQDGSQESVFPAPNGVPNGFAINPFDVGEHARLMLRLVESPSLIEQMQEHARDTAEKHFGFERFVAQHNKLYDRLITAQAPGGHKA